MKNAVILGVGVPRPQFVESHERRVDLGLVGRERDVGRIDLADDVALEIFAAGRADDHPIQEIGERRHERLVLNSNSRKFRAASGADDALGGLGPIEEIGVTKGLLAVEVRNVLAEHAEILRRYELASLRLAHIVPTLLDHHRVVNERPRNRLGNEVAQSIVLEIVVPFVLQGDGLLNNGVGCVSVGGDVIEGMVRRV